MYSYTDMEKTQLLYGIKLLYLSDQRRAIYETGKAFTLNKKLQPFSMLITVGEGKYNVLCIICFIFCLSSLILYTLFYYVN